MVPTVMEILEKSQKLKIQFFRPGKVKKLTESFDKVMKLDFHIYWSNESIYVVLSLDSSMDIS